MTGSDLLVNRLADMGRRGARAVDRAVYEFGEIEMAEMKERVPVDEGILKGSGFVEPPKREGNKVILNLGFGGQAEDYAIIVHEDLEAFHRVGEAKFVESVINESAPHFTRRVAASLFAELGM
jgi:hypothetical protein